MNVEVRIEDSDDRMAAYLLGKLSQNLVGKPFVRPASESGEHEPRERDAGLLVLILQIVGGVASVGQLVEVIYDLTWKRRAITKIQIEGGATIVVEPARATKVEAIAEAERATKAP